MLKRLVALLKPNGNSKADVTRITDHAIDSDDISHGARRTVEGLRKAGYSAYLVGGCVRDLLLGGHPKDFDVATDATPEQVRAIFRQARIIGRRFKIVHVRFGREIIEVTTFRGRPKKAHKQSEHNQSDKGVLLRDNVYGDIQSDALRRDFTVNALYFDLQDCAIYDFTEGLEDLNARTLRLIGDPDARYKEDPVRMLRAVRFAAKLGFGLTPETKSPILAHADYLAEVPPARLFEEVLKLFISGCATAVLTQLRDYGLLRYLFPGTDLCLQAGNDIDQNMVFSAVTNTDKRLRSGKHVTPAFIYAAMLWPPLREQAQKLKEEHQLSPSEAFQQASQGVISQQLSVTSIPKRFLIPMREIWALQSRLERRDPRRASGLLEHPRFRAAYDFVLLREQAGEKLDGAGLWWTRYQDADSEGREALEKAVKGPPKRRRRRRSRKPSASSSSPE